MPNWTATNVYAGTRRDWWYYVPAQYTGRETNLAVFLDGWNFLNPGGDFRAAVVLDNLIEDGLLPVTVAVFVNPGLRPGHPDCAYSSATPPVEYHDDPQRSLEYDTVSERQARFLLEDLLPVLEAQVNVTRDPTRRAVLGTSSGGIGAFLAAWFRPDRFGLVGSKSGSFVNIRGGHHVPWLVRNSPRKPLRVSLHSSTRDMDNSHGSWALANRAMAASLAYAGYEHRFVFGEGSHYGSAQAGSGLTETLLWLFGVDSAACADCQAGQLNALRALARRLGQAVFHFFGADLRGGATA